MYKCKCGREFEKSQSYIAHCGHCRIHLGHEPEDRFGESRAWMRGRTVDDPVYGESIRKFQKAAAESARIHSNLIDFNKNKIPGDVYSKRQSETRSKLIREGKLELPFNHRYLISYVDYPDGTSHILRSRYEFIFAQYLIYLGLDFEVESVRADCIDPSSGYRYFISDFLVGDTIYEIKGYPNEKKLYYEKLSFENLGYNFEVIYGDEIKSLYEILRTSGVPIDEYIDRVKEGMETKNYYHFPKYKELINVLNRL